MNESFARVRASGGAVTDAGLAKQKAMSDALRDAAVRAAKLKDELGDLSARSNTAAKGGESLASSFTSVEGILGQLKNQTGQMSQSLGELGFKMVAAVGAFKLGLEIGEKVRGLYQELTGKEMPNLSRWFAELITGANEYTDAEARAGVVTQSRISQHHARAQAIDREMAALKALWPELDKEKEAIGQSEAGYKQVITIIDRMANAHEDVGKWTRDHAAAIYEKLKPAVDAGVVSLGKMPGILYQAYEAGKKMAESTREQTKSIEELSRTVGPLLQRIAEKAIAEKTAAQQSILATLDERDARLRALKEMGLAAEDEARERKRILAETDAAVFASAAKQQAANDAIEKSVFDLSKAQDASGQKIANATGKWADDEAQKRENIEADDKLRDITKQLQDGTDDAAGAADKSKTGFNVMKKAVDGVRDPAEKLVQSAEEMMTKLDGLGEKLAPSKEEFNQYAHAVGIGKKNMQDLAEYAGGPQFASLMEKAAQRVKRLRDEINELDGAAKRAAGSPGQPITGTSK